MRRAAGALPLLLAGVTLTGCGLGSTKSIAKSGVLGQTFDGPGGLQVQLVRYQRLVPPPAKDVTGLATPKKGTHFAAFLIRMCIDTTGLPAISQQNFHAPLANGGDAELKFPETLFSDDLSLLGTPGCEEGHIVFQVPRRRHASDLRFALDVNKSDARGYSKNTKIRFDWALPT